MTAEEVREALERLIRDGSVVARADGSTHELSPVAITAAEGAALRDWAVSEGARHTIEIGLGYGVSALFLAEALLTIGAPDARHVVIDPNQTTSFSECGVQVLEEAGVADIVERHDDRSELVLPRLLSEGRVFDLAFVDGNHRFDWVFLDLVYLGRLVRPGGVVFVDDYQLPGIERAVAFFVANLGWSVEEVSPPDEFHRWAVVRTAAHADDRPFDHFVEF